MSSESGGRVRITLNGNIYHPVADVEAEDTAIERETLVNQDGTVNHTVKPKPYRYKFTFRDAKGLDLEELVNSCGWDATFEEVDMQRTVLLTNAFAEGVTSRNTVSGEISGISVVSDQRKVVNRA